jgi:cardiolipin synthase A/B
MSSPAKTRSVPRTGRWRIRSRTATPGAPSMVAVPQVAHWPRARIPRRWRTGLALHPKDQTPKGAPGFWRRLRRFSSAWWVWAVLAVIALVLDRWYWATGTGLCAFVFFVLTPAERGPRYGLDHYFGIEDPQFIPTMCGATGVNLIAGNRIDILNNGNEFYPAMLEAIHRAEASITIEAYIYWAGEIGRTFAQALAARARAGVPVKILLDAVGSSTIGAEVLTILESGRCQLGWYNPMRWYSIGRFNHRTHRKSVVVDGRVGFTGGAGIADHWQGQAEDPSHWRDIQIRLEGPCVVPLQTGFAHNWAQTTGELISGGAFYPALGAVGPLAALTIMSSPEAGASTVRTMHYLSIASARKSIFIANPYFVPDVTVIEQLLDAKRRGVDVRIMVSGKHNDNWVARQNSTRLLGPLLRAGIEILEFNRTMLHQKTMVVDSLWATIGTTNFDHRSFSHNEENNVCVYDSAWAQQLHQIFIDDLPGCDRVELAAWERRGWRTKSLELVAALFEDQS